MSKTKGAKRAINEASEVLNGIGAVDEETNDESSPQIKDSDIAKDIVEVLSKFDDDVKFKDALKFLFSRGLPLGLFVRGGDATASTKATATPLEDGLEDDSNGDLSSVGISGNSSSKESKSSSPPPNQLLRRTHRLREFLAQRVYELTNLFAILTMPGFLPRKECLNTRACCGKIPMILRVFESIHRITGSFFYYFVAYAHPQVPRQSRRYSRV